MLVTHIEEGKKLTVEESQRSEIELPYIKRTNASMNFKSNKTSLKDETTNQDAKDYKANAVREGEIPSQGAEHLSNSH